MYTILCTVIFTDDAMLFVNGFFQKYVLRYVAVPHGISARMPPPVASVCCVSRFILSWLPIDRKGGMVTRTLLDRHKVFSPLLPTGQ